MKGVSPYIVLSAVAGVIFINVRKYYTNPFIGLSALLL